AERAPRGRGALGPGRPGRLRWPLLRCPAVPGPRPGEPARKTTRPGCCRSLPSPPGAPPTQSGDLEPSESGSPGGTLSSGTLELLSKSNKATGFGAGGAELTIRTLEVTRNSAHKGRAPWLTTTASCVEKWRRGAMEEVRGKG
ncbi:unnamed protein product, partial [Gulo gulo]